MSNRYDWHEDAVCADIKGFTELRIPAQREVCERCPVVAQCLREGMKHDADIAEYLPTTRTAAAGWPVYGGKTVLERMHIARTQQETAA